MKSLTFSGKAPVDSFCSIKDKVHVFCEGSTIWDAMLNQTNVMNNNNKYYLIQLLEDNTAKKYYTWMRWGRVGFDGQKNLQAFGANLDAAKRTFEKKFSDKTKNDWEDRASFTKVQGKYDLLIMDYKAEENDEVDAPVKEEKPAKPESKLDCRVRELVELICNVQAMEEALKEMKYDTKKAPLGSFSEYHVCHYTIQLRMTGRIVPVSPRCKGSMTCSSWITRLKRTMKMKRPPLLRTNEEVKEKLELLEALGDIQVAITMLKEKVDDKMHPADKHYESLHCDLEPLDHAHDDFKMVKMYVENTHAQTHNQYKMEVEDVFVVRHQKEDFLDVGNRMLLWHGSRLTNWAGILKQGLRIAPPEAPVTGYMFGKGIYFADMSSKSANYCFATRSKNTGLVLLSEVSLGKSNVLLTADYNAAKLPAGHQSVKALGKFAPDPTQNVVRPDGLTIPCGKGIATGVTSPNGYTLMYNEYIVYDTRQVRMRYLVKMKFNFK
ncbi:predicted protein [Nematostella vectensis]|uniref:Poly [ADP-ribose] polymerase n=1 Tax=Nematostella vectensis TaxID=45351 RepID=A7RQ13_NEMVE|nr:predicted protein [Nematostella vectensis]|eukprot:XP_001638543.1 predicted protein [Nematostella vectensis]